MMRTFYYTDKGDEEYNWLSNVLYSFAALGRERHPELLGDGADALDDIDALFRQYGIKSIEELKEVLEISQKITQEYNNDKEI